MGNNRLQAADLLMVGTFSPSVVLDVARTQGLLARAGIAVREVPVVSSPAQFAALEARELHAVVTSPDNVIAYRLLRSNPLGRLLDIEIVRAIDRGAGLALACRPGLESLARGIRFGVDVPTSGFAFVGFALLESIGLHAGDYEVIPLGSTPRRGAALLDGACDATVLGAGTELRAVAHGARLIADVRSLGPYIGTVLVRLTSAPAASRVERLATALGEAASGILSGAYREAAVGSARRILALDADAASAHVRVLSDETTGLIADGAVDLASLRNLVALRSRFLPDTDLVRADIAALAPPIR